MKATLLLAALSLSLLPSRAATAADDKAATTTPSLVGSWLFNQDKSDDARAKLREAMGGGQRQGGGPGMGGRMGGGRMGGGKGGPTGGGMHDEPGGGRPGGRPGEGGEGEGRGGRGGGGGLRDLFEPEDMTISQDGASITFVYGAGDRERTLLTDGSKVTKEGPEGHERAIRAEWKGEQLVVRSEGENGRKVTETYELGPMGKRLSVKLEVETPRTTKPIVIMRFYDREGNSGSGN